MPADALVTVSVFTVQQQLACMFHGSRVAVSALPQDSCLLCTLDCDYWIKAGTKSSGQQDFSPLLVLPFVCFPCVTAACGGQPR